MVLYLISSAMRGKVALHLNKTEFPLFRNFCARLDGNQPRSFEGAVENIYFVSEDNKNRKLSPVPRINLKLRDLLPEEGCISLQYR